VAGSPFGGVQPGRCVCIAGVIVHLLFMDLFHCEPDRVGGASRCAARLVYSHRAGTVAVSPLWPRVGAAVRPFGVPYLLFSAWTVTRWYSAPAESVSVYGGTPAAAASLVSSSSLSCQCSCTGASGTGWTGFGILAAVSKQLYRCGQPQQLQTPCRHKPARV
jgi:hypothetical protein